MSNIKVIRGLSFIDNNNKINPASLSVDLRPNYLALMIKINVINELMSNNLFASCSNPADVDKALNCIDYNKYLYPTGEDRKLLAEEIKYNLYVYANIAPGTIDWSIVTNRI